MKTKLTKTSAECSILLHALFDNNQVRDMIVKNDAYYSYKPTVPSIDVVVAQFRDKYEGVLPKEEYDLRWNIIMIENDIERAKEKLGYFNSGLVSLYIKKQFGWKHVSFERDQDETQESYISFVGNDEKIQQILALYELTITEEE